MRNDCPCCGQTLPVTTEMVIDLERRVFIINGYVSDRLEPAEIKILHALHTSRLRVVARERLYDELYWRRVDDENPSGNIISVIIAKLRPKLLPFGIVIETIWGTGYSLKLPRLEKAA